ncbi:hypothetical protein Cgig2_002074 [Carnegiea gigantea]|uniref:Uncharacterized protein n=1 Tax=Carnegiea gigantea TaxID=171969 RepID=A0A9Q1JUA6_9CARY|nr:hypothetical protein Cgig2_002074 [Carnegiea gigantea]
MVGLVPPPYAGQHYRKPSVVSVVASLPGSGFSLTSHLSATHLGSALGRCCTPCSTAGSRPLSGPLLIGLSVSATSHILTSRLCSALLWIAARRPRTHHLGHQKHPHTIIINVLIEQKAHGATQFEWPVVKVLLKNKGVDKDATQIRNHYNDTVKKLKAWESLIGGSGVAVNAITEVGEGRFKRFPERVPENLDTMKAVVHSRHVTGDLNFFPAMGALGGQRNRIEQNVLVDLEEHMGDSDK